MTLRSMVVVVALTGLAACGEGTEAGDASCADSVIFEGIEYLGTGDAPARQPGSGPVLGAALGEAQSPDCADGGSDVDAITEGGSGTAFLLVGIDQQWAIAFGKSRSEATVYLVHKRDIPDDVEAKISAGR